MADFDKTKFGAEIQLLESVIKDAFARGNLNKNVDARIMGTTADIRVALKFKELKQFLHEDKYEEVNKCLDGIARIVADCQPERVPGLPFGIYRARIEALQKQLPLQRPQSRFARRWDED